ncbi:MAG: hypothetical protein MMC23_001800 [Stictis urceolatum]|nr:hypothetical protein [Stictis urceolata]
MTHNKSQLSDLNIYSALTILWPYPQRLRSTQTTLHTSDRIIEVTAYLPDGVKRIIATGSMHYVGVLDDNTVLKYPHVRGDLAALDKEEQLLRALGSHPRIIEYRGRDTAGLKLEYAPNGSLATYLRNTADVSLFTRLTWAEQVTEAAAYMHNQGIIHCDINLNNILLDSDLNLKLCDFEGIHKTPDGKILVDGGARENVKSSLPRAHSSYAGQETDIFALGSALYSIMTSKEPFPELDSDQDEAEILRRYRAADFPEVSPELGGEVIKKCWMGVWASAGLIVAEIALLRNQLGTTVCTSNLI